MNKLVIASWTSLCFFPEFKYKEFLVFIEGQRGKMMPSEWHLTEPLVTPFIIKSISSVSSVAFLLQQRSLSGVLTSLLTPLTSWLLLFCISLRKDIVDFSMNASTQHLTLNVFMVFSFMKVLRFVWSLLTLSVPPSWRK